MRKVIVLAAILNIIFCFSFTIIKAEEDYEFSISAPSENLDIDDIIDIKISLDNYSLNTKKIRGIQIDVTGIEEDSLEVISHQKLVIDGRAEVVSNETSYNSSESYIRYLYVNESGYLPDDIKDIMSLKLKVKDVGSNPRRNSFPVTIYLVCEDGNVVINKEFGLNFSERPTVSVGVDISWGKLEYVYYDGIWDSVNHKWNDNGWKTLNDGDDKITINNTGSTSVSLSLNYEPTSEHENITINFVDENGVVNNESYDIAAKEEISITAKLNGSGGDRWTDSFKKIGTISVTIGG